MLVLSRHRGEQIVIGDDVVITLVDIRGDKCRIGIEAPIELSVHRREVYDQIKAEERRKAAATAHCKCGTPLATDAERRAGVCGDCGTGGL